MSGPCMCGDTQCPSCGVAQGTYQYPKEKRMKKPPRSGTSFTQRGVKQVIKVGCLLRSAGYGSRIVRVIGRWKHPNGTKYWVMNHYHNTSWEFVPDPDGVKGSRSRDHWVSKRGDKEIHRNFNTTTYDDHLFLNSGWGWQVVKEVV